jgi:hypothetical protein
VVAAGALFSGAARAVSVPVVNFSFENPQTGGFAPIANMFPAHSGATMTSTANDWTYVGPTNTTGTTTGNQSITGNGMTLGTGDGNDSGYINNGPSSGNNNTPQFLLQDVGPIGAAGTQYNLTVAYANRSGFGIGATGRMSLYSVPNGGSPGNAVINEITAAPPGGTQPVNDTAWGTWFATTQELAFVNAPVQSDNAFHDFSTSYSALGADSGKDLLIVLTQTADASTAQRQANFDNVRLSATPEPASGMLFAGAAAGMFFRRRSLKS